MGIIKLLAQGFGATARKGRILVFLWVIHFLFSLLIVAPFYFLLDSQFSRSLMGEKLFAGTDLLWLGDLIYRFQEIPPLLGGLVIGTSVLFLLLLVFLHGGIIGRIAAGEEKITLGNFFGDCGRYFGRLFRVFLLSLVGYLVVFGILGRLCSIPFRLWSKGASTEWTLLLSSSLRLLVFLLLYSVVKMVFDYVKVTLVVENSRKTIRTTLRTIRFLGRRFFKAWALFLLVGALFVIATVVYLAVAKALPKTGIGPFVLFLWQQAYILARIWTVILFFATEYGFLKAHRPAV
ncbi:MAG: hypothetical protein JXE07_04530 [Candidatus Aminicenantes bacterium]|nr:hypothetical protein [Candidatus Aminicenantes bacterium]